MNMDFNYMIGIQQLSCWGRGCKKEGMGRKYSKRNSSNKKWTLRNQPLLLEVSIFCKKGGEVSGWHLKIVQIETGP